MDPLLGGDVIIRLRERAIRPVTDVPDKSYALRWQKNFQPRHLPPFWQSRKWP